MTDEEQLKLKQLRQFNIWLITLTLLSLMLVLFAISYWNSQIYKHTLKQLELRIIQLEKDCQRLIELKLKDQQQDEAVHALHDL